MAITFCINKAKKSSMQRLSLLPRIGIVVDFGGKQFVYRQAPILEALMNMPKKPFSLKTFITVSTKQLREITLPTLSPASHAPALGKVKR